MFCPNCGHKLSDRRFKWAVAIGLIAVIVLGVFLYQSRSQIDTLESDIQSLESRIAQAETEMAQMDTLSMFDNSYFDYRIYFPGSWRVYPEGYYIPGGFPIGWGTDWDIFFGDPLLSSFANFDRDADITIYGCDLREEYTHPVGLDYEVEYFISFVEDWWEGEVLYSNPAPEESKWDWIVGFRYTLDLVTVDDLGMIGEAYFLETLDALFRIDWATGDESYTETCKRIAESFTLY